MAQIVTYAERRLVKRHRGTMPMILTCPHDGTEAPANVAERTNGATPAGCSFKTGRDTEASTVTEGVAQRILEEIGLSPYVVIAKFHRKFIDANRSATCAFTDGDAQPFYDEYHNRIQGYVNQILAQNGNHGFLFDIHGTAGVDGDPADIYLGTANGATLAPGFSRDLIFMQHGLHGLLKWARRPQALAPAFRYTVSPADAATTESAEVNGGFTVRHYVNPLNCIQIELQTEMRTDAGKRAMLIEDLASALINFVRRHATF
jgi:N-formylglutamate amidohydrolase